MSIYWSYCCALFILILPSVTCRHGREGAVGACRMKAPCHCDLDNGQYLDLTSLGKTDGTAAFANVSDKHEMTYSWNPCHKFISRCPDPDVAVCAVRQAFPKDIYFGIGQHNLSRFESDPDRPDILQLVYDSSQSRTSPVRISRISLICESNGANTLTALGPDEQRSLIYEFELRGDVACPQGQPTTTTTQKPGSSSSTATDVGIAVASVAGVAAIVAILVILKKKGLIFKRQNYESVE